MRFCSIGQKLWAKANSGTQCLVNLSLEERSNGCETLILSSLTASLREGSLQTLKPSVRAPFKQDLSLRSNPYMAWPGSRSQEWKEGVVRSNDSTTTDGSG